MTQQVQKRNAQMVDLLRQDFQHRREPNYAWSRAVSMCLALPGLRAVWPMSRVSSIASGNRAQDVGGEVYGNALAPGGTGQPLYGYDSLAPYVEFSGANYLFKLDGGANNWADILGTEPHIVAAQRGLTLGGWWYFNNAAGAAETMMAKWDAGANRSYRIRRQVGGNCNFIIYDGAATYTAVGATPAQSTWFFCVARFIPSTSISIFVNDDRQDNLVGIPAALADSAVSFAIGAQSTPSNYMDGRASMCFLCAAQLSNAIILSLFEQTRALYGV